MFHSALLASALLFYALPHLAQAQLKTDLQGCMKHPKYKAFKGETYKKKDGGPVETGGELSCKFPSPCKCWRNQPPAGQDKRDFLLLTGDASKCWPQGKKSTYLGSVSPSSPDGNNDMAILESCSILCADSDVKVTAKFWNANNVKVQICTKPSFDVKAKIENCKNAKSGKAVTLPKGSIFDIALVAKLVSSNARKVVFLLEKIDVKFDKCKPPEATAAPTTPAPESNICDFACDFDTDSCKWTQTQPGNQWTKFQTNEIAGNEDTGVNALLLQRERNFPQVSERPYYAARTNPGDRILMTVRQVTLPEDVTMRATVYEACENMAMKVCQGQNCEDITPLDVKLIDREWKSTRVPIKAGTSEISIVADNSGGSYFCSAGIMDVTFEDASGNVICP